MEKSELEAWKTLRDSLLSAEDRLAFEDLLALCRDVEGDVVLCVLLGQQKRLRVLQRKLDALLVASLDKGI